MDWGGLSGEEVLRAVDASPPVASVWQYSEVSHSYDRKLLWHPAKGRNVGWLTVATVERFADGTWRGRFVFDRATSPKEFYPHNDRFEAAAAVDGFLEADGWRLCR